MTSPLNANSILMLDDESEIMSIFSLALERQGFHVVSFTEPLLALAISRKTMNVTG